MAYSLPSQRQEFGDEWKDRVNKDSIYEYKASGWGIDFNGDLLLHIKPDEAYDGEEIYAYLELEDGKCKDVKMLSEPNNVNPGFIYRGDYSDWKQLFETTTINPLINGTFEFEGSVSTFLEWAHATSRLVYHAQQIETEYEY